MKDLDRMIKQLEHAVVNEKHCGTESINELFPLIGEVVQLPSNPRPEAVWAYAVALLLRRIEELERVSKQN